MLTKHYLTDRITNEAKTQTISFVDLETLDKYHTLDYNINLFVPISSSDLDCISTPYHAPKCII